MLKSITKYPNNELNFNKANLLAKLKTIPHVEGRLSYLDSCLNNWSVLSKHNKSETLQSLISFANSIKHYLQYEGISRIFGSGTNVPAEFVLENYS